MRACMRVCVCVCVLRRLLLLLLYHDDVSIAELILSLHQHLRVHAENANTLLCNIAAGLCCPMQKSNV